MDSITGALRNGATCVGGGLGNLGRLAGNVATRNYPAAGVEARDIARNLARNTRSFVDGGRELIGLPVRGEARSSVIYNVDKAVPSGWKPQEQKPRSL